MGTGIYETGPAYEALESAVWCVCNLEYGLTYQSCRFCRTSWPEVKGLFKYAVRHYICADCRDRKLKSHTEMFVRELEKRSMSTWSDQELKKYSELTGQA